MSTITTIISGNFCQYHTKYTQLIFFLNFIGNVSKRFKTESTIIAEFRRSSFGPLQSGRPQPPTQRLYFQSPSSCSIPTAFLRAVCGKYFLSYTENESHHVIEHLPPKVTVLRGGTAILPFSNNRWRYKQTASIS